MYVYQRQVASFRGIATLLTMALVLWTVSFHMFTNKAEAVNLTYVKNTLSNSAPGEASDHEIEFLSPTGVAANGTITVTFPNGFNIATSGVGVADVDFEINGVDETVVLGAPGAAQWGLSTSSQDFILTAGGSESLGINATATIKIGTNADGGANQVTNHTATSSYEFTIVANSTSGTDSGQTRVAIIENVLVTANINTTFTFTVSGTTSAAVCNGADSEINTTNTTIPFGTLNAATIYTACQDLTVATNAIHGYVVTVEQDHNLRSSTDADIDGFLNGNYTTNPTAWASPSNNVADENTWGHWGLTSSDSNTFARGVEEFGSDEWVAASTTPIAIMGHDGPSDGTTDEIGRATIGYQVEITALQEAGDDYNATLTYIATPTF